MAISFNLWTDFRESLSFYIFARKQHSDRFLFYLFAIQCKCISSSALKNRKLTKIHICARKTQTIKYHHDSWGQNIFKVLNRLTGLLWESVAKCFRRKIFFSIFWLKMIRLFMKRAKKSSRVDISALILRKLIFR